MKMCVFICYHILPTHHVLSPILVSIAMAFFVHDSEDDHRMLCIHLSSLQFTLSLILGLVKLFAVKCDEKQKNLRACSHTKKRITTNRSCHGLLLTNVLNFNASSEWLPIEIRISMKGIRRFVLQIIAQPDVLDSQNIVSHTMRPDSEKNEVIFT